MKYSALKAFEKHLESAAPDHLSLIYVVISKVAFERKSMCDKIAALFLKEGVKAGQNLCCFDAEDVQFNVLRDELECFSFLAPKKVVLVTRADKLSKSSQDGLRAYFAKPNKSVCLILEAEALNKATNYYKDAEKAGIVLDVVEEKPWEKEKSLQAWVLEQLSKEGKKIAPATALMLVKQLGADQSSLHQELEKLICFVGSRSEITLSDISAICAVVPNENAWQLGEAIFRKDASEALRIIKSILESGIALIALLRQIRSQFQTGYQISCMLSNGKTPQDISLRYPYMKGTILNKNLQQAQSYGMQRFKAGILAIDETELMAKNSGGEPDWLAERLIYKLATK